LVTFVVIFLVVPFRGSPRPLGWAWPFARAWGVESGPESGPEADTDPESDNEAESEDEYESRAL
jgi:hypothetical protein